MGACRINISHHHGVTQRHPKFPPNPYRPKSCLNPFMPTVPTFAVRETDVSRTANVGTVGMNGLNYKYCSMCQIPQTGCRCIALIGWAEKPLFWKNVQAQFIKVDAGIKEFPCKILEHLNNFLMRYRLLNN